MPKTSPDIFYYTPIHDQSKPFLFPTTEKLLFNLQRIKADLNHEIKPLDNQIALNITTRALSVIHAN